MTQKREYVLKGLDCANCAAKMETAVKKLPGVCDAGIDFIAGKLRVEAPASRLKELDPKIKDIIHKLEPDVKVLELKRKENKIKEEELNNTGKQLELLRLIIGAVIFLITVFAEFRPVTELVLYAAAYILIGGEVILRALRNILRGKVFDENFLMIVATIGAFAIRQYSEAVAVMLFYQIGETFQDYAVNRSRHSIRSLMDIKPDYANLRKGEEVLRVDPEEVSVGDIILVKPGERVPLDGRVIKGDSMLDTSALTGEAVPRRVQAGENILSGFINNSGLLEVEVNREFSESTVSRILDLVENAGSKKASTENFITKFARFYTPGVVYTAAALAVIPPLLTGAEFSAWFYRALIFLVVSCPCALVISIPLSFFGGIGGASQKGVLVKGGNFLEALNSIDTVVFDKTGTLTKGVFKVTSIVPESPLTDKQLLEFAALAEYYSNHPIAKSVLASYNEEINKDIIADYEEIAGCGIKAAVEGKTVLAGNNKLMEQAGLKVNPVTGTVVHVVVDGKYAGYLLIADEMKEDSRKTIKELRDMGVEKIYMLTGDSTAIGSETAQMLDFDAVFAELLPHEKVEKVEELQQKKGKGNLIYIGDGINDAPVLARADVGVAMGALGSDAAIEAADIVLMTDEPSKLVTAISIAKRTRSIVWQNIIFSLGVKGVVLLLGAGGLATIWEAVFADVGVALIAIVNAMRVMRTKDLS